MHQKRVHLADQKLPFLLFFFFSSSFFRFFIVFIFFFSLSSWSPPGLPIVKASDRLFRRGSGLARAWQGGEEERLELRDDGEEVAKELAEEDAERWDSFSLRQKGHTPWDCRCSGCFLHLPSISNDDLAIGWRWSSFFASLVSNSIHIN